MQILKGSMQKMFNFGTDSFGQSIDICDDIAVIGSDDTPLGGHINCGVAYIYKNKNNKWKESQKLFHPDPLSDSFYGWSVSINEDKSIIAIGADDQDTTGKCAGAVYVFKKTDNQYRLKHKLYPPILDSAMSYFGFSIDVKQNMLLVGAPVYRGDNNLKDGSAYLFKNNIIQQFKTRNMGKTFFGGNVKIANDHYIITAHREGTGAVYIYDNKFNLQQKITKTASKTFGKSIAIYNNYLLIGAPLEYISGAAYLYEYQDGHYKLTNIFEPSKINNKNCFGYSVDINKDYIVISDIGSHSLEYENYVGDASDYNGRIYIYNTSTKTLRGILDTENKGSGHCLKLNNDQLFEGNPNINNNEGAVKIYDL